MSSLATTALRSAKRTGIRAFHSPFAVLGNSPLTSTSSGPKEPTNAFMAQYEKHYEHPSESSTPGYRTYVVSEPDASSRHFRVPAGAYPTSAPYVNFTSTNAPEVDGHQYSSTSSDLLAHGVNSANAESGRLAERNPPPDGKAAEKFSKAGVEGAWTLRK